MRKQIFNGISVNKYICIRVLKYNVLHATAIQLSSFLKATLDPQCVWQHKLFAFVPLPSIKG